MQSIHNLTYRLQKAVIWHIIGAILWISGINWGIWTIILTQSESPFFFVFDSSEAFGADASDFTPLLAVAIILSILIGVGLHVVGVSISREAIIDLDLASKGKQREDKELKELQEMRERLAQVEQKLDQPNTS